MSWNVTGNGSVEVLRRHVEDQFEQLLKDDPHKEYSAARKALLAVLEPLPSKQIYLLESYGSFGTWKEGDRERVSAQTHIDLKTIILL